MTRNAKHIDATGRTIALSAILCAVLISPIAHGQRLQIKAGYGLLERRDSVLVFRWDSTKTQRLITDSLNTIPRTGVSLTTLRDSLDHVVRTESDPTAPAKIRDSLNNIPRSIPYDSLRRIGRDYVVTGSASFTAHADTSGIRLFGSNISGGLGGGAGWTQFLLFQAPQAIVLETISISHSFDTTTWRRRDTLINCSPDSIPAGALVWCAYLPASQTILNGTGAQVLRIYYSELNSATGTYLDDRWKIPLINGVLASHRGIRPDHHLRVTLRYVEKVPGRIY